MTRPSLEDDADLRKAICEWLTANDINPHHIPTWATPSIADGQLTIQRKVQRNGRDVIDPTAALSVLTETVTVPVTVPPPPLVETWLAPRCPTCGR